MKALVIVLAALALGACSAPEKKDSRLIVTDGVKKEVEAEGQVAVTEKSRVRCERVKKTGSHMVTRVCYTQEEWDARREASRDALDRATSRQGCLDCGGDG